MKQRYDDYESFLFPISIFRSEFDFISRFHKHFHQKKVKNEMTQLIREIK